MITKTKTKMKMIAQSIQMINMVNIMIMETKMKMIEQSPQIINIVNMMIMKTKTKMKMIAQ